MIKYVMIVLSFGICLAAILNKYLPQMASGVDGIESIQETAATYINLISGVILVLGLPLGFYASRMHTEGTVLRDRYDSYVFDNQPNHAILKPVSQTMIDMYSRKIRKNDEAFRDNLFSPNDDPQPLTAQFDYINREVHSDYRLYISIQPFFMTLWIGFCVMIVILAVSFNDTFVTTLINIMIPSLSAISSIATAWYNYRQQLRQLQNLMTVIDQIQRLPDKKRSEYISDKKNMRALADGLYNYRSSAFVIPNFLVRRHLKNIAASDTDYLLDNGAGTPATEMPTLVLPDITDDVPEVEKLVRDATEIRTVTFSKSHTVSDINTDVRKKYTRRTPAKSTPSDSKPERPASRKTPAKQTQNEQSGTAKNKPGKK